jgi:hypothetical protein
VTTPQILARLAVNLCLVVAARLVWAADPGLLFLGIATATAGGWARRWLDWMTAPKPKQVIHRG